MGTYAARTRRNFDRNRITQDLPGVADSNPNPSAEVTPVSGSDGGRPAVAKPARPPATEPAAVGSVACSEVITFGDRTHYYRLPPIQRWQVVSETPKQIRVTSADGSGGINLWQHKAICLPPGAWKFVEQFYQELQASIDAVVSYLKELGSYSSMLEQMGAAAPNPITPWVISIQDPATDRGGLSFALPVRIYPACEPERKWIFRHTPKMLEYDIPGVSAARCLQADHFCCPDDVSWNQFQRLWKTATDCSEFFQSYLTKLGTYDLAKRSLSNQAPNRNVESDPGQSGGTGGADGGILPSDSNPVPGSDIRPGGEKTYRSFPGQVPPDWVAPNYGARAIGLVHVFGEERKVEGVLAPIQYQEAWGPACLMADVLPDQVGFQWEIEIPEGYREGLPPDSDGIHRGYLQIDRRKLIELPPEPKFKAGDRVRGVSGRLIGQDNHTSPVGGVVEVRSEAQQYGINLGGGTGVNGWFLEEELELVPVLEPGDIVLLCRHSETGVILPTAASLQPQTFKAVLDEISKPSTSVPKDRQYRAIVESVSGSNCRVRPAGSKWGTGLIPNWCFTRLGEHPGPLPFEWEPLGFDEAKSGQEVCVTDPANAHYGKLLTVEYVSLLGIGCEGCEELFQNQELGIVIPPEPEPETTPVSCPSCTAPLARIEDGCGTCGWAPAVGAAARDVTALMARRNELLNQIHAIRVAGEVAPKGCWIESYQTSKKLASGERATFTYYRVKAYKDIFQGEGGKRTKQIHLGSAGSSEYKDWADRMQRRREVTALEKEADKIERKLQK